MSVLDYALLGLIALAVVAALRRIRKGKGRCGGCSESCPHRKP